MTSKTKLLLILVEGYKTDNKNLFIIIRWKFMNYTRTFVMLENELKGIIYLSFYCYRTKRYQLWEFVLDNQFNRIEMFHSVISGKKKLCLNNQVLVQEKKYSTHFNYAFRISSCNLEIYQIRADRYELRINNKPFELLLLEEKYQKNSQDGYSHYNNPRRRKEYDDTEDIRYKVQHPKKKRRLFNNKTDFTFELNNDYEYEYDSVNYESESINKDNNERYSFSPQTHSNKKQSFDSQNQSFTKKETEQTRERPQSKFMKAKSNESKNDYGFINNNGKYDNLGVNSTLNTNKPANISIMKNAGKSNPIESFFDNNNSDLPQNLNLLPKDNNLNINANPTIDLLQINTFYNNKNNNEYYTMNNHCSQSSLVNGGNPKQKQFIKETNYPLQEHCFNPQTQSNSRYQDMTANEINTFETNASISTNQSNPQTQFEENKLKSKISSSGLVDINNILGNQAQYNNATNFQFKRPSGFD